MHGEDCHFKSSLLVRWAVRLSLADSCILAGESCTKHLDPRVNDRAVASDRPADIHRTLNHGLRALQQYASTK